MLLVTFAHAQEAKRVFDIPAADAAKSLKQFSEQSGHGLIVASETVKGVRTNPVKGAFAAADALARLLNGTGLIAKRDDQTGAFAVHKEGSVPNAPRAAQATVSDQSRDPEKKKQTETAGTLKPMKRNNLLTRLTAVTALLAGSPAAESSGA
ncbi:MAG: secretin and TonB N-terminal domain-containing protein, partial [Opitutaceae bacterium]